MRVRNRRSRLFKQEAGLGLVEVLVAGAVAALLGLALTKMMSDGFRSQAKLTRDLDKVAVRNLLASTVSCADTLPAGTCVAGSLVDLKRKKADGTVVTLISNTGTGTRFGNLAVRAVCAADGESVLPQATLMRAGAPINTAVATDFLTDPYAKTTIPWSDARSFLFPPGLPLCLGSNGASAPDHFGGAWACKLNTSTLNCGACLTANPITGGCSCPAGFATLKVTGCNASLYRCGFVCAK